MNHLAFVPFPALRHARLPSPAQAAAVVGAVGYALVFAQERAACSVGLWGGAGALVLLALVGAASAVLHDGRPSLAASAAWTLAWVVDVAASAQWPGTFTCAHAQPLVEGGLVVGSALLASGLGAGPGRGVGRR